MKVTLKKRKELPDSKSGRKLKYPFNTMQIGHYFEMKVNNDDQKKRFYSIYTAARRYADRHEIKFASRIIDGTGSIQRIE